MFLSQVPLDSMAGSRSKRLIHPASVNSFLTSGATSRYKVLNIGFEYVFGSIKSDGTYIGPTDRTLDSQKNVNNNFRILLGVKL